MQRRLREDEPASWLFRARLLLWVWLYLLTVAGLLWLVSPTAELDQAEQLVLAQRLQWGYTNQAPLYTWLMWGIEQWSGPSLGALLLVKTVLLGGLAWSFLAIGHALGFSPRQHVLSLAGLAWLPSFVWEAQRDLTHSVLAATLASLTLWASLWAIRRGTWLAYAVPGMLAAGAVLAKHNALIFVVGLLLTLLSLPDWRKRLHAGGVLLAIALVVLLCAPHAMWLQAHPEVLAQITHKLAAGQHEAGLGALLLLFKALAMGLLSFLTPWLFVALPLWWFARRRGGAQALLSRLLWVLMAVLLLSELAFGAESFKSRWLFPILFFLPLCLAASVDVDAARGSALMVGGGIVLAIMCAALLPLRVVWPLPGEAQTRQNLPFIELGQGLRQAWGGTVPPVVLVSGHHVGGNLRLAWGAAPLIQTPLLTWPGALPDEVMVVASDEDLNGAAFADWLHWQTGRLPGDCAWQQVQAPLLHRAHMAPYTLHWARVTRAPDKKRGGA